MADIVGNLIVVEIRKDFRGFTLNFQINPSHRLGRMITEFKEPCVRSNKSVQFFFQGTKVGEEERANNLGMEDGA